MRTKRLLAELALAAHILVAGCTDARLFGDDGSVISPDRVAFSGRICASDTLNAHLPVRIVLVVDRARAGLPAWDAGGQRFVTLRQIASQALIDSDTKLAVVGFATKGRVLAPLTSNPSVINGAIDQLGTWTCPPTEDCVGRNYLEGLRSARTVIEGDLAETPAGERGLTQYVVVLVVGGAIEPGLDSDCLGVDDPAQACPGAACHAECELAEVARLVDAVGDAGALGVKLHVLHLASDPDGTANETVRQALARMAFAAGGVFQQFGEATAFTEDQLSVLAARTALRVKSLSAANLNAKPTAEGHVPDSDADGLSDAEEESSVTNPRLWDTDGDSIGDLVERLVAFDPADFATPNVPTACRQVDAADDRDLDGLYDCEEVLLGTDPTLVDSDGDAMPDLLEVVSGTDYLHRDSEDDSDGDGTSNGEEILQRSDPRSTDSGSHLGYGYRYDIEDEGVVHELFALGLTQLTGVEILEISRGSTVGVGQLTYSSADRTLSWKDIEDGRPGTPVDVSAGGDFVVASSSYAPVQGDSGRFLRTRVTPVDLPPNDIQNESVTIISRDRQCLNYTVRNIRLMDTKQLDDGRGPGLNRIVLFFAETPEGRLELPGPVRIAEIPVTFRPPSARTPSGSILTVYEEEFVRPR